MDFITETENGLVAMEVKRSKQDVKQLKQFIEKFGDKTIDACVLDAEGEGEKDGVRIIPIWKFLLGV